MTWAREVMGSGSHIKRSADGERRTLARSPNTGYFHTAGPAAALPGPDGKPASNDKSAVRFRPGDLRNWPNLADIDLYGLHHWEVGINPLNPYRTGPSVHFAGGQIKADGKSVCALPVGAWAHVEMTCPLGAAANGKWALKVSVPGQTPVSLTDLPCDPRFRKLQWLGIVADANAAVTFYVDHVTLEVVK